MKPHWIYSSLSFGLLLLAGAAICFLVEGEINGSLLIIPLAIALSFGFIAIVSNRDKFLFYVMLGGLLTKLFAAWIYTALDSFKLADVHLYYETARQLSSSSTHIVDVFSYQQLWGTNFISVVGAYLFSAIGPSLFGIIVLFAITAFWGQFLFYRAFIRAFPTANSRPVALALFFFPSIVYWTATFGKDALMMLAIGLIAYGVSRRFDMKGWMTIFAGFVLATVVRPHMGAFLSISLFASYLIGDIKQSRKIIGLKFLLFPLFLAVCWAVMIYARTSLEVSSMEDAQSMSDYSYKNNQVGGSAFGTSDASITSRFAQSPSLCSGHFLGRRITSPR